jgi:PatG C-terminal
VEANRRVVGGQFVERPEGDMRRRYVYAIGRIEARLPRPSIEDEIGQAAGRGQASGRRLTQALISKLLSERKSRHLAEGLRWVLTVEGAEIYLLQPHDPRDLIGLIESLRSRRAIPAEHAVVGLEGPIAPPEYCNGLRIPIVVLHQVCSFDLESLIDAISNPDDATRAASERLVAHQLRDRALRWMNNSGTTDEHRALNYLVMRYPGVYLKAAEQIARDFTLAGIEVRRSPLAGPRRAMDVIFVYTNRTGDSTEKFCVRVDVTEEFPFLVTRMSRLREG